jgi:hypothetical protein
MLLVDVFEDLVGIEIEDKLWGDLVWKQSPFGRAWEHVDRPVSSIGIHRCHFAANCKKKGTK